MASDPDEARYSGITSQQEHYIRSSSRHFCGLRAQLQTIDNYVQHDNNGSPLIVTAESGQGKSYLLAKAVSQLRLKADSAKTLVFSHFVDGSGCRDLRTMVLRLFKQAGLAYDDCRDLASLCYKCHNYLSDDASSRTVIVIDGIHQFHTENEVSVLSWLPRKLARHIRVIISVTIGEKEHELLVKDRLHKSLSIPRLDFPSGKLILKHIMRNGDRVFSVDEIHGLIRQPGAQNPLWLNLAHRLICDSEMTEIITKMDELPDGLLDLIELCLAELESSRNGDLILAILSSLTVSKCGLTKDELKVILKPDSLKPPSPYVEKQDFESSEKQCSDVQTSCGDITESTWHDAYHKLKQFIIPHSKNGTLNIRHSEMKRSIKRRYFRMGVEDGTEEEGRSYKQFWHAKLADYFESCDCIERRSEELPYHLQFLDEDRIVRCLTDWEFFDSLFDDIQPRKLLDYWKHQSASILTAYATKLKLLEEGDTDYDVLALRHEQVARVFLLAGHYDESLELAKSGVKMEVQELNSRPERLANLFDLISQIYDEKLKLHDFVSFRQLPDLRRTISYGRRSIELREKLDGEENKLRLGLSLMKLAFSLDNWEACGADASMTGAQAVSEGNRHINRALGIFTELNDIGHMAEALMTKGVLARRGSSKQLKYYHQAMDICQQLYGEHHVLVSRLYINIGIVYEDKRNYLKAYQYFKKWAQVTEEVLGPNHPKTLRARNVLNEDRYREIAETLEQVGNNSGDNSLRMVAFGPENADFSDEDDTEEESEAGAMEDISTRLMNVELDY